MESPEENRKRKAEDLAPGPEDETTGPEQEEDLKRAKLSSGSNENVEGQESKEEGGKEEEIPSSEDKNLTSDPAVSTNEEDPSTSEAKAEPQKTSSAEDKSEKDAPADGSEKPSSESKEEKSSVFGSATEFSGFGAVKNSGFGFNNSGTTFASNTTGFGSAGSSGGFGSSTAQASGFSSFSGGGSTLGFANAKGFGMAAASESAFGTSANSTNDDPGEEEEDAAAESATTDSTKPVVELPTNYENRTGEEDESTLFQARCRTHRLVPTETTQNESGKTQVPASKKAPAVPHSQSFLSKPSSVSEVSTPENTWQEVGIGPLKVLQNDTTKKIRIVQRREVSPSGPATKVIVNAVLHGGSLNKIHQPTEKHVQWTTPVDGKAATYLFKFGSPIEASQLSKVLTDNQPPAGSSSDLDPKESG